MADDIKVFLESDTPFVIRDEPEPDEGLRMRYRYLDLRRLPMLRNLKLEHKALAVRTTCPRSGFWEVETYHDQSTPEGPGIIWSLHGWIRQLFRFGPVAGCLNTLDGFRRRQVFSAARCYRDEDLRADRQPEFTQIDIEVSFSDEDQLLFNRRDDETPVKEVLVLRLPSLSPDDLG